MREMFWATAIRSFAVAAVGVFEPIYLYQLGIPIYGILLFFIADYILYFLLTPLGGKICRRHGYEQTILFSSPFLILYYLTLFAIPYHNLFIGAAVVAVVIHKILYWPGYHANFATWMNSQESGREVSNRFALTAVASAIAPFLGSVIIVSHGFGILFVGASVLILLSNLPLLRTPEFFLPTKFPYLTALKRFAQGFGRLRFWSMFGFGEQFIAVVLWPIFIVIMIPNLISVGAIVSLTKLINVWVTLYVGRLSDEDRKDGVLHSGSFFTMASWLLRPFVTGPLGIFLIDSYYLISRNMIAVPYFSFMYESARYGNVMASIVFNEMALSLGKIVIAVSAMIVLWFWPNNFWTIVFLLAAIATISYSLMPYAKLMRYRTEEVVAPIEKTSG
jgi:hypothetical protein